MPMVDFLIVLVNENPVTLVIGSSQVTSDFENMIQSFAADFELTVNRKNKIAMATKNLRLLHDIEKLSELAFYSRTKQIKFIKETN